LVTTLIPQSFDVLFGICSGFTTIGLSKFNKSRLDVLGHSLGVTANIDVGVLLLNHLPYLLAILTKSVLNINLFVSLTRECINDAGVATNGVEQLWPFILVKIVFVRSSATEEE
jgi:hypothetical protein